MSNVKLWNPNINQYVDTPDPNGELAKKCVYPAKENERVSFTREALRELIRNNIPYYLSVEQVCAELAGPQPPTVEDLALALFASDEEVLMYVRSRAEGGPNGKRLGSAMDACWRINDRGFRAKCEARAKVIAGLLGRKP